MATALAGRCRPRPRSVARSARSSPARCPIQNIPSGTTRPNTPRASSRGTTSGRSSAMTTLYNENHAFAASWLRQLERSRHIAPGVVDDRSITDLTAGDLAGVRQFHAFAGLGGWSYALRLAGVPDDAFVWTGSCPCQPFSNAGGHAGAAGTSDRRHLWPVWRDLIAQCFPPVLFGEQVSNGAGRAWFDVVRADLEGLGYAVGAADLCAAGIGAPHIRQRLYFVATRGMCDPGGD